MIDRRTADIAAAENANNNLANALVEETSRAIEAADLILINIQDKVRSDGILSRADFIDAMAMPDVHGMLQDQVISLSQVEMVGIAAADGHLINSSRDWPPVTIRLADREYFQALRDNPSLKLFITGPVLTRTTGQVVSGLARRIDAPDGTFLGIGMSTIKVNYLTKLYHGIVQGDGSMAALQRLDGTLLARYPQLAQPDTAISTSSTLLQEVGHNVQTSRAAFPGQTDSATWLLTGKTLPDYPLVVVAGRSQAAVLAAWWRQTVAIIIGAAFAAAALLVAVIVLARQIGRREASEKAFAATLDNVVQGIMMIDHNHRVSVCNPRAMELLDLPAELMDTKPRYDDLLRFQRERGEFGSDDSGIDDAARQFLVSGGTSIFVHTFERRRPNGTMLEVSSVPLSMGGMVRTYTDVTAVREREAALEDALSERDRAEAALRQRRDSLERELAARTQPLVASEALHRDAAEVASDWIWETNSELTLTFVSKRFGDTSGIAWSEVSGRALEDLVALGFDPDGMADLRVTIDARGTFQPTVYRVVIASGRTHFWRMSGKPFFDPTSGAFAGYRGSGTDVTAAIEHEAALNTARLRAEAAEKEAQQTRARLLDAINAIPEGFVLHDAEDRLVLCNARYSEIYGLSAETVIPGARFEAALWESVTNGVHLLDESQNTAEWVAERLRQHRAVDGTHFEQRLANGRWLQVDERRTSDGGTVGIRVDVTEARQLEAIERDRERTTAELQAARLMQISLLPSTRLLNEIMASSGLDIASRSASCSELGGDLWGLNELDHGLIGFYIVDFAGHGTTAALNTFRLHALIHELRSVQKDPAQFLKELNVRLTELLPPGTYTTMFYGVIDLNNDCIRYAAAGSPPPIIRGDANCPLTSIDSTGVPLGISANADYDCCTVRFAAGGMLCLYSDVLTDCVDEHGLRSGEKGAFDHIQSCARHPTAETIVERTCAPFLEEALAPLSDDLTVVCIRRT